MKELIAANLFSLNQLDDLLQQLSSDHYSEKLDVLSNSSIGMHFRHVLEFYDLLLNCGPELCYDDRPRKYEIETEIESARKLLSTIMTRVGDIEYDRPVKLWASYHLQSDRRSAENNTL